AEARGAERRPLEAPLRGPRRRRGEGEEGRAADVRPLLQGRGRRDDRRLRQPPEGRRSPRRAEAGRRPDAEGVRAAREGPAGPRLLRDVLDRGRDRERRRRDQARGRGRLEGEGGVGPMDFEIRCLASGDVAEAEDVEAALVAASTLARDYADSLRT